MIDNYRPVSNLPAAAKLLELVICEQTSKYVWKGQKLQSTFYSDVASLWNKAPESIKNAKTLYMVKREIKKFVLSLPI